MPFHALRPGLAPAILQGEATPKSSTLCRAQQQGLTVAAPRREKKAESHTSFRAQQKSRPASALQVEGVEVARTSSKDLRVAAGTWTVPRQRRSTMPCALKITVLAQAPHTHPKAVVLPPMAPPTRVQFQSRFATSRGRGRSASPPIPASPSFMNLKSFRAPRASVVRALASHLLVERGAMLPEFKSCTPCQGHPVAISRFASRSRMVSTCLRLQTIAVVAYIHPLFSV